MTQGKWAIFPKELQAGDHGAFFMIPITTPNMAEQLRNGSNNGLEGADLLLRIRSIF